MNMHVTTYQRNAVDIRKRLMNPPPRPPRATPQIIDTVTRVAKPIVVTYRDQNQKDAHVIAWVEWRIEQAHPCKAYIRRRAKELGYTYDQIMTGGRNHDLAFARHLLMWEIKAIVKPEITWPELGRLFGGRDHTTCLYAVRKIAEMKARGEI